MPNSIVPALYIPKFRFSLPSRNAIIQATKMFKNIGHILRYKNRLKGQRNKKISYFNFNYIIIFNTGKWPWNAKVYNFKIYNMLKHLNIKNRNYIFLKGDYSRAYEYAEIWKNTNFGGYKLFKNNCLHYIHSVLNYVNYGCNTYKYKSLNTIIPSKYIPIKYEFYTNDNYKYKLR